MRNIEFQIKDKSGISRTGKLVLNNKIEIITPVTWFGLSIIENCQFQLEVFKKAKAEAFLSNVYDLYYFDKKHERLKLIKELQKLGLRHKIDSGGFQLMKAEINNKAHKFPLNPKLVLDKQIEVGCDIAVQLDFPFGTNLTKKMKKERLNKTLSFLEDTLKLADKHNIHFSILPVIHTISDDINLLKFGLEKIERILGKRPIIIGIGSLVPLVKTIKNSKKNGIESFIYALITLRKMLPDSLIHAFGIGGTMAYLAIFAGIDSFDSNGWIQKSAYGVIQLPGISDRFLRKESHNRPYLISNRTQRNSKKLINEIDMFMKCRCAACQPFYKVNWNELDWNIKKKAFIGREQTPKKLRAIHNVSLYQSEILLMRKAIKNNRLEHLIKNRLRSSVYYKYVNFINNLKSQDIESLSNFHQLLNSKDKKIAEFL